MRTGRPLGSFGPVALAMLDAAGAAPGTVRDLAQRACVGLGVAKRTASRLVAGGHLVRLNVGRPAMLARRIACNETPAIELAAALHRMAARSP